MYELTAFCKWCQFLPYREIAATLQTLGVDGGDVVCRRESQITPDNAPRELPAIKAVFDGAGLSLKTMVTDVVCADSTADRVFGAAADIGVERVRLGFLRLDGRPYPERFIQARRDLAGLEKLLERRKLRGSLQFHSGGFCLEANASAVMRLLDGFDPAVLGVQFDPGHLAAAGEPIGMALDMVGAYLHGVNVKSPRYEPVVSAEDGRLSYRITWVPLKDGMVNVPRLLAELRRVGYGGTLNLFCEYCCGFYSVEHDVAATTRLGTADVVYLKNCMAAAESF